MYNRYIPQADGTYRRNRVPDRSSVSMPQHTKQDLPRPVASSQTQEDESFPTAIYSEVKHQNPSQHHRSPSKKEKPCKRDAGIDSFLQRLLPKDFDTGDLLIVILLLLMAGDCQEDQNSALLTLLIYFLM